MSFFCNIKLIADYLKLEQTEEIQFEPTYHRIAQSFSKWPIVVNENGYKIKLFEWGVIADYMNTPEKIKEYRNSMANARSEKIIDDKRSVWYRIRKNRCLVFTTGFFEHHDAGLKKKIPYFIHLKNEPIFCFAGLYNYSPLPDIETGEAIGTFAIVTRPSNSLMSKIHNGGPNNLRMPLILTKELSLKWLNEKLRDHEIAELLKFEYPASKMEAWPVNTIRTRKPDDNSVIKEMKYENFPGL
jgi:putative SOS response-associated peptidase YedK